MNKIEIKGTIAKVNKKVYPSGCCLAIAKITTILFDGTIQNLSVNFFNNEDKKLADIISNDFEVGDKLKIIALLKPCEYRDARKNTLRKVTQFMAKNIIKAV